MKIKKLNESHSHGAKIFCTRNMNEEVSKKFHFEFTVDGIKSSQDVNANSMQLAKELIQKQYTGKNVVFQKSQEVLPTTNEDLEDLFSSNVDDEFDMSTEEISPAPELGVESGMSATINALIRDEWEALDGYNSAIVTAKDAGLEDIVQVLTHIQNEENKHVGELQECLKQLTPSAEHIEVGAEEAEKELQTTSPDLQMQGNSFDDLTNVGNEISVETSFFEADDDINF